jgi:hypothetical protein
LLLLPFSAPLLLSSTLLFLLLKSMGTMCNCACPSGLLPAHESCFAHHLAFMGIS